MAMGVLLEREGLTEGPQTRFSLMNLIQESSGGCVLLVLGFPNEHEARESGASKRPCNAGARGREARQRARGAMARTPLAVGGQQALVAPPRPPRPIAPSAPLCRAVVPAQGWQP